MTRFLVRKRPLEIVIELVAEGDGPRTIPAEETDGLVDLLVMPGDYIATGVNGERYPLTRTALEASYDWVRELGPDE